MLRLLFRKAALFSKITPQILPTLTAQFEKQPSLKALGPHYSPENTDQLFDLIISSKVTPAQSNGALEHLLELCRTETDEELNLVVNVMKQKAINYTRLENLLEAASQFEQAAKTILLMKSPNELALSQIYKFIGDLYVQSDELPKAEKALRQAEHLLKEIYFQQPDEQAERHFNSGLASIHTQLCMVYYRQKLVPEAVEELQKALNHWQKAPRKFLAEYELTCRMKCMIHMLLHQKSDAVITARLFLGFLQTTPEYKQANRAEHYDFMKLYYLNIICIYKPDSKQEETEVLAFLHKFREVQGEERLEELMAFVGIPPKRYTLTT